MLKAKLYCVALLIDRSSLADLPKFSSPNMGKETTYPIWGDLDILVKELSLVVFFLFEEKGVTAIRLKG